MTGDLRMLLPQWIATMKNKKNLRKNPKHRKDNIDEILRKEFQ